jgi:hypothetical protein
MGFRDLTRRAFLARTAGAAGVTGLVAGSQTFDGPIRIRVWFSERAARYADLGDRIETYLSVAFADLEEPVEVSFGGTVAVSTENGYDVTASGEWPTKLVRRLGEGPGPPVAGVNLLVTDGSMEETPTGIGLPHLASVGGARHVARMPPDATERSVFPFTDRSHSTQVLIHECGHALGLRHVHGRIVDRDHAVVVTPMVSAYAWAPEDSGEFDADASACGEGYPDVAGKRGYLDMAFSTCALTRIRQGWFEGL